MRRRTSLLAFLLCLAAAAGVWWRRLWAEVAEPEPEERVRRARAAAEPVVQGWCKAAGVACPPSELFFRAFKFEKELEVWARSKPDAPFRLLTTLEIAAASGDPGPKRREGDRQVPEGFYKIDLFNPRSSYHLSMRLDYPNASDRILSDREHPGSDIYIHGKAVSIGCLAMGDTAIDQLYTLAHDVSGGGARPIPVHIFPARMEPPKWATFQEAFAAGRPELTRFWATLQPAYEAFEKTRLVPQIEVQADGRYVVKP